MKQEKIILMVANVDWIFIYHRLEIAVKAKTEGYRVIVLAKNSGRSKEITDKGLEFVDLPISRSGTNIFKELKVIRYLFNFYKKTKPIIAYHVTMKPIIYGTLVSKFLQISTVNGVSGLGYNFTGERKSFVQKIMIGLMTYGFDKTSNYLVFENKDDYAELKDLNIVKNHNEVYISKGVGVNLQKFYPIASDQNKKTTIILPARMLWDKGVKEFVNAALLLKEQYFGKVFFKLYGMVDLGNKEAVPEEYLNKIKIDGYLEWLDHHEEMIQVYKNADVVVLPSYREGMPTVLLEACAMGLPIVTTNAIGCKECVEDNVNGFIVPLKNVDKLATAIKKLIDHPKLRLEMGKVGRVRAESMYDRSKVVQKHIKIFNSIEK